MNITTIIVIYGIGFLISVTLTYLFAKLYKNFRFVNSTAFNFSSILLTIIFALITILFSILPFAPLLVGPHSIWHLFWGFYWVVFMLLPFTAILFLKSLVSISYIYKEKYTRLEINTAQSIGAFSTKLNNCESDK